MLQTIKKDISGKYLDNESPDIKTKKHRAGSTYKGLLSHVFYLLFCQNHSVVGKFFTAGFLKLLK